MLKQYKMKSIHVVVLVNINMNIKKTNNMNKNYTGV